MELLKLLVDQVPTVRLFLLLTARFEFRPPWPLHAHVAPIVLTRLTRRQAEEMVGSVAGTARSSHRTPSARSSPRPTAFRSMSKS